MDPSLLASLNRGEQKQLEQFIELQQMASMMELYFNITQKCFTDCIVDFSGRKLNDKEGDCLKNCVPKNIKVQQRLSQRFAEHQMMMNEGQQ